MLEVLGNRIGWMVALALCLALWLVRAGARQGALRADLKSAILSLLGYVAVYAVAELVDALGWPQVGAYAHVVSYLLFALGAIQAAVGLLHWGLRARRGLSTPKILRDVAELALVLVAAAAILHNTLHIDLGSLLATSAALSVIVGLALQETLGNLFAGLVLQVEPPFSTGDWITVGGHTGRVVQVAWRGTRIVTLRREEITIPNGVIAKESVVNFSRSGEGIARDLALVVDFRSPPQAVVAAGLDVLRSHRLVRPTPPPIFRVKGFLESGIEYQVRVYAEAFVDLDDLAAELLSQLWYRLRREGFTLPYPTRTLHLVRPGGAAAQEEKAAELAALLSRVDFLRPLGEGGLRTLGRLSTLCLFGAGEYVIRQGEAGDSFYLIVTGEVAVQTAEAGEVARLKRGDFFGEMSLLTGEPRAATVVAGVDSTLLTVTHAAFGEILQGNEDLARALSEALATRAADLKAKAAGTSQAPAPSVAQETNRILGKLRQLFGL